MSILAPNAGEIFNVRVYKHLDIAVDRAWANTYELRAEAGASFIGLEQAAQDLVTYESRICHDTVTFDRVVVSTYVPDGEPYDPEAFISMPLSGVVGTVASPPAASVLPLQVALFVRRVVSVGRSGKLFYRQTVGEDDVSGRYGSFVLSSPAAMAARFTAAATAANLGDYIAAGSGEFKLVMVGGPNGSQVRLVTDLAPVDVRLVKFNNRYYDRA